MAKNTIIQIVCYEYVLLPLVNKKFDLAYSKAEYNQAGRDR